MGNDVVPDSRAEAICNCAYKLPVSLKGLLKVSLQENIVKCY